MGWMGLNMEKTQSGGGKTALRVKTPEALKIALTAVTAIRLEGAKVA